MLHITGKFSEQFRIVHGHEICFVFAAGEFQCRQLLEFSYHKLLFRSKPGKGGNEIARKCQDAVVRLQHLLVPPSADGCDEFA